MSWLNLNHSLNSLKGQITNIASEVFSEATVEETADDTSQQDTSVTELKDKCRNLELETASLKKLVDELRASLQSERLSRKNGIKEDEGNWYWDPSPQQSKPLDQDAEFHNKLQQQIRDLQNELSTLRERDVRDVREDEFHRLKEENKSLSSNLEDLDSQHQLAMERLLVLKKELQHNFEGLKQEHEDLKNTNEEYSKKIKDLTEKLAEKDRVLEAKSCKSDYDTLLHKYKNLESIYGLLKENAEKFQEENQELHEEVFKLQEQVTKLDHDIEVVNKQAENSDMVSRLTYEDLLKELNDLKDRRNSSQIHFDEINIDDNAKSVIDSLRRDINELKHKLSQKEGQDGGDNKIVRPEKVMQMYNKYVNFELPIDYVGEIPSAGDNIVLFKLESVFKTLHSFKKEIDVLEHKLSEKNLNTNHLQTQIDDLTTENDFLTTDIQHLERELSEMKKNNDFLISEIAALKNTSKLEPIIETHEDNLAKLETELADCTKLNKNFESEILRVEKELKEVQTERKSLKESLSELRQKYTIIINEFETYKNQTKELEDLESSAKNIEGQKFKKAIDEIDDLKKRLNVAATKNEQLSIDIHILENDKVLFNKQVNDLKEALEDKSNAHKESEYQKSALEHKLHDIENKLDVIMKENHDFSKNKLNLDEKLSILEHDILSYKTCAKSMAEVDTIASDKKTLADKTEELTKESVVLSEMVNKLKSELHESQRKERDLITEKLNCERVINDLKAKIVENRDFNNEIEALKSENRVVSERKVELETELSYTDEKMTRLETEFEKLISDLNEKRSLIDHLNTLVQNNNGIVDNLNKTVSDLKNSIALKDSEIDRLQQVLNETKSKLNDTSIMSNSNQDELKKLQAEKEDAVKTIISLNDEILAKVIEISTTSTKLDDIEKLCDEYKTAIEDKDKTIKELSQSLAELTDKMKAADNLTHLNDDYAKLLQEKEAIQAQVSEFRDILFLKERSLEELQEKHEQFEKMEAEFKALTENATTEKTELINLINLKHNESIQYHNEIQRLNHVLLEQNNEFKRIIEEKDALIQQSVAGCTHCEHFKVTLKEKDDIIVALNKKANECDRLKAELVNATEAVAHLKERCENLDRSMAIQLDSVKTLTAKNIELSEQEQNLERELERLRRHLMETEENYTQELMASEQKLTECQARLHNVEERAKQTSTVYTSNSIRANQEVETLRTQIKLLEKQRDEVQVRLSEAEDARSRSEAALTNLQVVLEQFQLDKERDIYAATEKIRNKMEDLKRYNNELTSEINNLNVKLNDASAGLQAATRLGDQVETKTAQINDLKEQVRTLQTSVAAAEERYYNAISNQQDKVDKNLVKNLVINYVVTATGNQNNKTQVLRVLSTVLDFNQQECERLGLVRAANTPDSLAAEFVKFLQNESRPRAALPNMMTLGQNTSRSATPTSRKNSTIGAHPNIQLGHSRNPSTGSNNLLFTNIDTMETASQRSRDSDREPKVLSPSLDTGVNQTRNTEGAILKSVLKDM